MASDSTPKPRRLWRWLVYLALALFFLGAAGTTTIYALSSSRLNQHYDVNPRPVFIPDDDPREIARGKYLARTLMGCVDCHGENFAGRVVVDDPAIGLMAGPNLTRGKGSRTKDYTDIDWVRALRHGVARDGHALVLMPATDFNGFGDDDLGAVIAFLKQLPPVDNETPPISVGPLARALILAGEIKLSAELIDHEAERPITPPPGPTREYGKVLANVCSGCHGFTFSGGKIPGAPPEWPAARNITPDKATGIGTYTFEDFKRVLREGKRKNGDTLSEVMPYKLYKDMSEDDITALWLYLKTLEPKAAGGR